MKLINDQLFVIEQFIVYFNFLKQHHNDFVLVYLDTSDTLVVLIYECSVVLL